MNQDYLYETVQGDTWDLISFKIFGTEKFSKEIAQNNVTYIKTVIFSPGILLNIPKKLENTDKGGMPPWL